MSKQKERQKGGDGCLRAMACKEREKTSGGVPSFATSMRTTFFSWKKIRQMQRCARRVGTCGKDYVREREGGGNVG